MGLEVYLKQLQAEQRRSPAEVCNVNGVNEEMSSYPLGSEARKEIQQDYDECVQREKRLKIERKREIDEVLAAIENNRSLDRQKAETEEQHRRELAFKESHSMKLPSYYRTIREYFIFDDSLYTSPELTSLFLDRLKSAIETVGESIFKQGIRQNQIPDYADIDGRKKFIRKLLEDVKSKFNNELNMSWRDQFEMLKRQEEELDRKMSVQALFALKEFVSFFLDFAVSIMFGGLKQAWGFKDLISAQGLFESAAGLDKNLRLDALWSYIKSELELPDEDDAFQFIFYQLSGSDTATNILNKTTSNVPLVGSAKSAGNVAHSVGVMINLNTLLDNVQETIGNLNGKFNQKRDLFYDKLEKITNSSYYDLEGLFITVLGVKKYGELWLFRERKYEWK